MYYVYLIQSISDPKRLYIGATCDLKKRLNEHNNSRNTSTKGYVPWQVIYYEACINKFDAFRRERYLKTSQGSRLLKRRLKEYFYQNKLISTP